MCIFHFVKQMINCRFNLTQTLSDAVLCSKASSSLRIQSKFPDAHSHWVPIQTNPKIQLEELCCRNGREFRWIVSHVLKLLSVEAFSSGQRLGVWGDRYESLWGIKKTQSACGEFPLDSSHLHSGAWMCVQGYRPPPQSERCWPALHASSWVNPDLWPVFLKLTVTGQDVMLEVLSNLWSWLSPESSHRGVLIIF